MPNAKNSSTQVLVVGAGPTGLMAAAVLAKLGVRVRIIEQNAARSVHSKALGVHAGTLECLDAVLDPRLAAQMIELGCPAREAWVHVDSRAPVRADLSTIPSRHGFILILPQSETERILEEYLETLGVRVERQTPLSSLENSAERVVSRFTPPSGAEEELVTDFVIGCDGAHSMVRHQLQIPFQGGAYDGEFVLGDVELDWPWSYGVVRTFAAKSGAMAAFPMGRPGPTERRYRLVLIPKRPSPQAGQPQPKKEISLEEVQAMLSELSGNRIRASHPTWLTRFNVHHRIVRSFGYGRTYLAGDAAHIHSPAGGQGMNVGMQDAMNLAFKLKRILAGEATLRSLEDYQRERMPVAKAVMRYTDLAFKMALKRETATLAWLRGHVFPRLIGIRPLQKRVVAAISEVRVARREIERGPGV